MKYCSKCGKEIADEAVVCTGCGCIVEKTTIENIQSDSDDSKNKIQVSQIIGIIGIVSAWLLAIVGHITSIFGIIVGITEYKKTGKMPGLILCIIGEVCAIISSIIGAVTMASIF